MTSPASTPVPHSRWLVRENVNQLATSHAAAAEAISALHTAEDIHRDRNRAIRRVRPPLRQRLAMRRDWPQVIWFCLVLLALALFLGWVSARLVARLVPAPVFVAVLPGALLAAATGGAARFATHSIKHRDGVVPAGILPYLAPLTAASAVVAAWVSLWLVLTSGTPALAAVVFALGLTLAVAVALMTCSYLGGPPTVDSEIQAVGTPVTRRPPRHLLARHRRARSRLDAHTRRWTTAAHRYAVTIGGQGHPKAILASLLADDAERLPLDDLDPFDAMILCGLRDYHPAALAADLSVASAKLVVAVNHSAEAG
jgi:hypothetical protein